MYEWNMRFYRTHIARMRAMLASNENQFSQRSIRPSKKWDTGRTRDKRNYIPHFCNMCLAEQLTIYDYQDEIYGRKRG